MIKNQTVSDYAVEWTHSLEQCKSEDHEIYFQKEISFNKQFYSANFQSSKRVERKTFLDFFFFKEKIQDLESRVFNIATVCINQKYELVHTGVCQKKKKKLGYLFC